MQPTDKILALLAHIAASCGTTLSDFGLDFIARTSLKYGTPDEVVAALEQLAQSARRVPTVADIRKAMGRDAASEAEVGREVGERIWEAISKHGSQRSDSGLQRVREFLGDLGWEVVTRQGGWQSICDSATYANGPQLKAQWRELAEVLARKVARGEPLDSMASLPRREEAQPGLTSMRDLLPTLRR